MSCLTAHDASIQLGISTDTIRRWEKRGSSKPPETNLTIVFLILMKSNVFNQKYQVGM